MTYQEFASNSLHFQREARSDAFCHAIQSFFDSKGKQPLLMFPYVGFGCSTAAISIAMYGASIGKEFIVFVGATLQSAEHTVLNLMARAEEEHYLMNGRSVGIENRRKQLDCVIEPASVRQCQKGIFRTRQLSQGAVIRPDLLVIDDPITAKTRQSPTMMQRVNDAIETWWGMGPTVYLHR